MEKIKKYWGQKTKAEKYLEYVNDWLTIEAISDNYGMTIAEMKELLNEGKIEHLENCLTAAKDNVKELLEALLYYKQGIDHFYKCINFGKSTLDAKAIEFMNDSNIKIYRAIKKATT